MLQIRSMTVQNWEDTESEEIFTYLATTRRVFILKRENALQRQFLVLTGDNYTIYSSAKDLGRGLHFGGLIDIRTGNAGHPTLLETSRLQATLGERLMTDPRLEQYVPTVQSLVRGPAFHLVGETLLPQTTGGGQVIVGETVDRFLATGPDPAYPHLHRWLSLLDWPLPAHQSNALGWALAGLCRASIKSFPFLLIDALRKNSGKTRLARGLAMFISGAPPQTIIYTGNEAALELRMGHLIGKAGPSVILFDNVRAKQGQSHQIRSQLISSMVTDQSVWVNTKYRDPSPVFAPIVLFTMNGAQVEQDLSDRAMLARLGSWTTDDAAPDEYCEQHLPALRAEACHLLSGLHVPKLDKYNTRHHTFERIVMAATAKLGLPAHFSPRSTGQNDPYAEELFWLITDREHGDAGVKTNGLRLSDLVSVILSEPRMKELNEYLRICTRPKSGLHFALGELIEAYLIHGEFFLDNTVFSFTLGKDSSNVKILNLHKEDS